MVRSVWKGPFVEASLLKKADAARASGRHDVIKIWSRRSTILPQFVGLVFGVYNGQKHVPVSVNEEMVGHKFGEFSPTISSVTDTGTRKWTGTSSASFRRPGPSMAIRATRKPRRLEDTTMSKPSRERALADNEAKAVARMLRVSPQKLNLVAQ